MLLPAGLSMTQNAPQVKLSCSLCDSHCAGITLLKAVSEHEQVKIPGAMQPGLHTFGVREDGKAVMTCVHAHKITQHPLSEWQMHLCCSCAVHG